MVYQKTMKFCITFAIVIAILSSVVFANTELDMKKSLVATKTMEILITVSHYSWPVMVIILAYAMYQYYIIGAEEFEHKVAGQKLILGTSIFMAIIQTLPLISAFITINM